MRVLVGLPRAILVVGISVLLFLSACDVAVPEPQSETVVVSYFQAGKPLGNVYLVRSAPADDDFAFSDQRVAGSVVVERLGDDGTVVQTIVYDEGGTGHFSAPDTVIARPGQRYRLRATRPEGPPITAETTIPGSIRLVKTEHERAIYQATNQPSVTLDPSAPDGYRGRMIVTTKSQLDFEALSSDELERDLTPFHKELLHADKEKEVATMRITSMPIERGTHYRVNDDGTVRVELPWIAVAFYGSNTMAVSVLDENLFDFVRTQRMQQRALAPGDIPNVIDHVDGGTGIFGSFARVETEIVVERDD